MILDLPLFKWKKVGVACSGGKDSLALLVSLAKKFGSNKVIALHIDHQVRNSKSCLAESQHVSTQCKNIGVIYKSYTLPKQKKTSENTLRTLRYQALAKLAKENLIDWVALGHHKLDQSESFILHLLRGSDINGLSGMRKEFKVEDTLFFRPLLNLLPSDCQKFLDNQNIQPFVDPTNSENLYKRNRVRNELFPLLESLQLGVSERLADLSESFREISDWKAEALNEFKKNIVWKKNNNNELLLSKSIFEGVPKPIVREWCYETLSEWAGGKKGVSRRHVSAFFSLLHSNKTGFWHEVFPGNAQIRLRKREIVVKLLQTDLVKSISE